MTALTSFHMAAVLADPVPVRVLVVGGGGYLGRHVCKALARSGYLPVTYDMQDRGDGAQKVWGPVETGGPTDVARLRAVIRAWRPAGVIEVGGPDREPGTGGPVTDHYRSRVAGTATLVGAMLAEGLDRIVLSSSGATYGAVGATRVTETAAQMPLRPFGVSLLMTERIVANLARDGRLGAVALRCFNLAGADPEGEAGALPQDGLIPRAIAAAEGRGGPFTVHGVDHDTPDGTCERDFVHVSDLARAYVAAFGLTGRQRGFHAYNLGSGRGVSVREVLRGVERLTGRAVPWRQGLRRPGDPAVLVADCGRAREAMGWRAEMSDLDTILATTWAGMEPGAAVGGRRLRAV